MARLKALVIFAAVLFLAGSLSTFAAGSRIDSDAGSFKAGAATTSAVAVFAPFVSLVEAPAPAGEGPNYIINTAVSVTNTMFQGPWASDFLDLSGSDTEGTVTFAVFDRNGSVIVFDTGSDPGVCSGGNDDGTLGIGQTITCLLSDIVASATAGAGDGEYDWTAGWAWVVGNFDGVQGTGTVTSFGGFNQSFTLSPGIGQGTHGTAGLPVYPF